MKPYSFKPMEITVLSVPRFGLSLGEYIFIGYSNLQGHMIRHEVGHTAWSRRLGPLYLLIVGVPSVFWNIVCRITNDWSNYYKRWPEKQADIAGGVKRT
jgi:hypothetical protein